MAHRVQEYQQEASTGVVKRIGMRYFLFRLGFAGFLFWVFTVGEGEERLERLDETGGIGGWGDFAAILAESFEAFWVPGAWSFVGASVAGVLCVRVAGVLRAWIVGVLLTQAANALPRVTRVSTAQLGSGMTDGVTSASSESSEYIRRTQFHLSFKLPPISSGGVSMVSTRHVSMSIGR